MHANRPLKDIACVLHAQTKDATVVCVIGCQITRTRIPTLPKRLASARHDNKRKTVFLPECTLQTKGGPYIVVAPVVTSWAVAGQQMVFLHMYLQTRATLRAFPIATPRGRSSKFPWRGIMSIILVCDIEIDLGGQKLVNAAQRLSLIK